MVTAKKTATTGAQATAKRVAAKSAVAKPVTAKPAATKAAPAARKPAAKPTLSAEQRSHYVEVAAFYIAERRGFAPADPAQDWADAEVEIDRLIASGHFSK